MPVEPAERLEELLDHVLDACNVDGDVEVDEDQETLRANVDGDDLGLLIGRHGQTIDALEHLAARIAFQGETARKRLGIPMFMGEVR